MGDVEIEKRGGRTQREIVECYNASLVIILFIGLVSILQKTSKLNILSLSNFREQFISYIKL